MNTCKEAASPPLTTQTMPSGSGVCRAMLRGRSSGLKGADASRLRPACRPALDPGDLGGPWGSKRGQARACPGGRRGTPITTYSQDQESSNHKIEVSTVPGDCPTHLNHLGALPITTLTDVPDKTRVLVGGIVTHRQRPATAKGVTFINLEDETGMLNITCSPGLWTRYRKVARTSPALLVRGMLEHADGVINLNADRLTPLTVPVRSPSRDFR